VGPADAAGPVVVRVEVALDLPSALLTVLTVVPAVYAVKQAASHGGTALTALVAGVGLVSGVLFVRSQRRLAVPLFDLRLFHHPAFSGAVGANLLSIAALSGLLFFLSQYLQLVRGYGPLEARRVSACSPRSRPGPVLFCWPRRWWRSGSGWALR
jgi:hypothetical protein